MRKWKYFPLCFTNKPKTSLKKKLSLASYSSLLGKMLEIQFYLQSHPWKLLNMFKNLEGHHKQEIEQGIQKVLNLQKKSLGYDKIFFRHQTFVFLPQILFVSLIILWMSIHCINIYYVFIHKNFKALKLSLNISKWNYFSTRYLVLWSL